MGRMSRVLLLTAAGLAVAGLAAVVKIHHLKSGLVSPGKTDVELNLTVRGTGGRPVKNAKVSVFDPEQIILGHTNQGGQLSAKTLLSSGRSLIVQVDGVAFKMQRSVLIPRSLNYKSSLFFDLAEVHEGNVTLISTADVETASLMSVPKPTPEPPQLTLAVDAQKLAASSELKAKFIESANLAALKFPPAAKSKAVCESLDVPSLIVECELITSEGKSYRRLMSSLPLTESDAKLWLESFFENDELQQSKFLRKNEIAFAVKHSNQKYRAYFGHRPLRIWKQKTDSHFFRTNIGSIGNSSAPSELTIITEDGRILQRTPKLTGGRKIFTVRIPAPERLNLSKR